MITAFLIVFFAAVLVNLYVIVCGRKDIDNFKQALSIGKYLSELNTSMVSELGEKGTAAVKVGLFVVAVLIVIFNVFFFLAGGIGLVLGTMAAKRLYQFPAVSNVLNKIGTYVNRMR